MSTKKCPKCGVTKPLEDFAKNRRRSRGVSAYCKPCHNRIVRENRTKIHGSTRSFHLKRRYGVDAVEVEWMILQQGGKCAICRRRPAKHVDHDHHSKKVRGFLCFNCNRGLGYLKDDWVLMCQAADYLEAAKADTADK